VAALLKFDLPNVLAHLDKVLYLDGDLIVRGDLAELYATDLTGRYLAAVVDSGSIYYRHKYVQQVQDYFNSGVMLLNLALMRSEGASEKLVEAKRNSGDSLLMDQNVFNVVFDGKVRLLPIRYNLLYVNLLRAKGKYTIGDINRRYQTQYHSLDEVAEDALIVHYSSKDKPWKSFDVPLGEEWRSYFQEIRDVCGFVQAAAPGTPEDRQAPKVSVVIPVYNTEEYLKAALDSVAGQTLTDIEVICVDDGSTDGSPEILRQYAQRDRRFRLFSQPNGGQSSARNVGIRAASGTYVYFFDSDDLLVPTALETLYRRAEEDRLQLLLFDGETFYDTEELKARFPQYETHYIRNKAYPGVWDGGALYAEMVSNGDYKVSPCLQFFRCGYLEQAGLTYLEGIIYEDNLFAMQAILLARRAGHTADRLFRRRVRGGSTMTRRPTFRNFRGYYICLQAMYLFILENAFSDAVVAAASKQLSHFLKTTGSCYRQLSPEDKRKPWCGGKKERMFSELLYRSVLLEGAEEHQSAAAMEEIRNIHASASYRIGRFITLIPRKLRGGVRCYREHGWRYTWQRLLVHLGLRPDSRK